MHFRTHLQVSLLAGIIAYPRSPRRMLLFAASGVLIDLDHLLVYCVRSGDWSLSGALVYDRYRHHQAGTGDTRPRYGHMRSWVHHPLMIPLSLAAALHWPLLRPVALGVGLHLCLDHLDLPQRLRVRWRSGGRCAGCGTRRQVAVRIMPRPVEPRATPAPNRSRILLCNSCLRQRLWQGDEWSNGSPSGTVQPEDQQLPG